MPKSIYIAGPYSGSCEALRPVPKRIYIESICIKGPAALGGLLSIGYLIYVALGGLP